MRLGINIDHVATLRNARGGVHPDPLRAARLVAVAGGDQITAHLREDRRHITDSDLAALVAESFLPLNMEMAATEEMVTIALGHRPFACCIVPERRQEVTTEGGLDAAGQKRHLAPVVQRLRDAGIRVSLFVDPELEQVAAAREIGADAIELHTGAYCDAAVSDRERHLEALRTAAAEGARLGLEIHAGHGLAYDTVGAVAAIPEVEELNIGHFLVGEAIFVGLEAAIRRMRMTIDAARDAARRCGRA